MDERGTIMSKNSFVKDAKRIMITGASGTGKSHDTKEAIKKWPRVVVFDSLEEYGSLSGFVEARSIKQTLEIMRKKWKQGFKIAFVPRSGIEIKQLHELSLLLLLAQKPYKEWKSQQKILFIVEEMNECYPNQNIKDEYWGFGEICSRGRHSGIEVIGICQRLAEVNTRFRGNCSYMKFFEPADHVDVSTILKMIGPKYKDEIIGLGLGEYCKKEKNNITFHKNGGKKAPKK